jgi:hypothetical protein
MRNWLRQVERDGGTVLRACLACASGGQYLDDPQGRADHRRRFGHLPRPGRPLAPLLGLRR